jgi:hypothetical protein
MNMYKKVQYVLDNTRYVARDIQIDLDQLEANCYSFFEEESCKTKCVSRDCPLLVFRILDAEGCLNRYTDAEFVNVL